MKSVSWRGVSLLLELLIICLAFSLSINAQNANHHRKSELKEVLNPDGSIKSGITGSFKTKEYELELDKGGKPIFRKSSLNKTQSIVEWNSLGNGRTGITNFDGSPGNVYAVAVNSVGDIYVGGWFRLAGDMIVNNIVKWDLSEGRWAALPCGTTNGVNGYVESIAIKGTDVYVAGRFLRLADETQVNYIAKFNETTNTWSPLTDDDGGFSGVNDDFMPNVYPGIFDIGFIGDILYVGGDFLKLGDGTTPALRAAKWDGTDWYPLTSAGGITGVGNADMFTQDFVDAIEVGGDKVYIGGSFTTLSDGTTAANNIAIWDETNDTWSSLTHNGINGIDGEVYDIAVSGTTIYVGGEFATLGDGSTTANNIAKWDDGAGWSALISGSSYGVDDAVCSIVIDGTDIYISGSFTQLDDNSAPYNCIAKWNGTSWSQVSSIINGVEEPVVYALAKNGDNLYVCGIYMYLGDLSTNAYSISKCNLSSGAWSTFGSGDNGVDNAVRAVVINGNYVYAGGYFTTINGGLPAKYVARWNYVTKQWSVISSPTTGIDISSSNQVFAMAVGGNYLYVAGIFSSINNGTTANNIARYNLQDGTWSVLSDGTNSGVNGKIATITVDGNDVYIGGEFTALSGGSAANYVAKWNEGTGWSAITDGVTNGTSGRVLSSAVNGEIIYLGGYFNNLICWNKTSNTWSSLTDADLIPNRIRAITINGSDIYIACDNSNATVAKWDSENGWTVLNVDSKEPQPPIYSLCFYGNDLYVGGGFTQTYEPTSAQGIMKYNISSGWETLTTEGSSSTGVNNCIYTFAVNGTEGKIYIGGYFTTAGGKAAVNIANFMDTSNQPPDDPVDPTPFVVTNTGGSVKEGGFFIFNDLILNSNDNDGPSYSITYVIQNDPNHGQLINGTASSVSSHFTFTQNDIANGKIKYVHNGDESSTDNFNFTLVDSYGNVSPVYTFNIIVTGINDPHYLTGLPKIEFSEDVPYLMPIDVLYKYLYDPDDNNTSLNIELFSLSDSLLCQASGDTAWVFCGKENMFGKFKTRVSISDGEFEVDTTFYVTVVPINDIPVITGIPDKIEFIVTGSSSIHLNGCATDVETPDSLLTYSFICEPDSINFHYNPKTCLVTLTSKNGFIGNASLCIHIEDTDNGVCDKTINITVKDDPTGVKQITGIPEEYRLYQNYPNPFNPSTIIRYGIPVGDAYNASRNVLLKVYDILGNEVVTLVDGQQSPGYYEVKWNASNLSSGIYFYIISVNGGKTYREVRKMLLIK